MFLFSSYFEIHDLLSPFYPRNVFWIVGKKCGGWFKIPPIINIYLHSWTSRIPIARSSKGHSLVFNSWLVMKWTTMGILKFKFRFFESQLSITLCCPPSNQYPLNMYQSLTFFSWKYYLSSQLLSGPVFLNFMYLNQSKTKLNNKMKEYKEKKHLIT